MKPRIAIVDAHTLVGVGLARVLERDHEVVGTYTDVHGFLAEARHVNPDIVLLDVMMPSMSGIFAAREILGLLPQTRIIFMTTDEDPATVAVGFGVGGSGYVTKRSASSELTIAIREVMSNRRYISPLIARNRAIMTAEENHKTAPPVSQLTPRQRQVLQLLASGRSMKEAAAVLDVSMRTVAFHKYQIMKRHNFASTAELIRFAMREGLV